MNQLGRASEISSVLIDISRQLVTTGSADGHMYCASIAMEILEGMDGD